MTPRTLHAQIIMSAISSEETKRRAVAPRSRKHTYLVFSAAVVKQEAPEWSPNGITESGGEREERDSGAMEEHTPSEFFWTLVQKSVRRFSLTIPNHPHCKCREIF